MHSGSFDTIKTAASSETGLVSMSLTFNFILPPPWGLDLILLPLVAFDNQGNRLGMGGGFYDRTLSSFNTRHRMNRPQPIGLAHECQRIDQLKAQTLDIPLDGVITEQGITYWQR